MYQYLGLIAIIPGVIYFTYFINRFLRNILNIHTVPIVVFTIGLVVLVISFPAINVLNLYGTIYYHILVITLILELFNFALKRYFVYRFAFTSGILTLLVTLLVLGYGYYNIKNVVMTKYSLTSDKIDHLKIVEIADLHMSTSMNVKELTKHCDQISKEDADIIVLTGDIFDENTPYQDMIDASKILGKLKNKLGIYYVYGNHERANYQGIEFTVEQIEANLEANGITVLNDEVVCLEQVNLIGRKDASFWGTSERLDTADLMAMIPKEKQNNYTIILDHQPLDLEVNAKLNIDLQLSGHTHGGQLFPMRFFQSLTSDTLIYGQRKIDNFVAITTSGIAGWRYPIKTGAKSEYVVIEIN
ncbi:metallophosphoesterase [Thomasclavelia sp.]|uniref:metallophosphoesterase n=1 Tax=Thomasclavelia sp. TaxID=3025757 RepID=UPI0025E8B662|nr:metallophosphoesterase [Thomasclavelia sp.]